MENRLVFAINGKRFHLPSIDPLTTLLKFLRTQTRFKGAKLSCGEGGCGACVVLLSKYNLSVDQVEDFTVSACLTLLCSVHRCSITTTEGLRNSKDGFHPIHQRFSGFHASQCGFCTPGMCMSLFSALIGAEKNQRDSPGFSKITMSEAEKAIAGNLCRYTGYRSIADACKSFAVDTDMEDKHYVKITGTPHGWDVLFYIFQFIRVTLLFTVIVLIGTGWSFLKPFLQEREKKVLMIVIPLQVLANLASVVIGETGPFIRDWVTWNQVFLLVDIICCCAIIFPIVWSIRSLRETSKTDGKAARNLAKLTLFRQFYIVVIGYLYFTRIVVFALRTISAYKYQWVSSAAEEIASLTFYLVMFYMFRPVERNQYFVLDEEEEEAAEKILQDEEFEL